MEAYEVDIQLAEKLLARVIHDRVDYRKVALLAGHVDAGVGVVFVFCPKLRLGGEEAVHDAAELPGLRRDGVPGFCNGVLLDHIAEGMMVIRGNGGFQEFLREGPEIEAENQVIRAFQQFHHRCAADLAGSAGDQVYSLGHKLVNA